MDRYLEIGEATLPAGESTLTLPEAAAALGISVKTARRRIKSGELPAVLTPGPRGPEYRVRRSGVAAVHDTGHRAQRVQAPQDLGQGTVQATLDTSAARIQQLEEEVRRLEARLGEEWLAREETIRNLRQALENEQRRRLPWEAVSQPPRPSIPRLVRWRRWLLALAGA